MQVLVVVVLSIEKAQLESRLVEELEKAQKKKEQAAEKRKQFKSKLANITDQLKGGMEKQKCSLVHIVNRCCIESYQEDDEIQNKHFFKQCSLGRLFENQCETQVCTANDIAFNES